MASRCYTIKITVLGDSNVGKTNLVKRFVENDFDSDYHPTCGSKIAKKTVLFKKEVYPDLPEDTQLNLVIWDVAGRKVFQDIHKVFFNESKGSLVVCDVSRKETLESSVKWINDLRRSAGNIPIVLLINKIDLKDQLSFGKKSLKKMFPGTTIPCYVSSARTGRNVEKAFLTLLRLILDI